jgi:hypothetical protein
MLDSERIEVFVPVIFHVGWAGSALGGTQRVGRLRAQVGEGHKPIYVYNTYTCVYYRKSVAHELNW